METTSSSLDNLLVDLGLTHSESQVFLGLLKLGSGRAAQIVHGTGLQNSVVHLALGGLIRKGLVSFVRQKSGRVFRACHPRELQLRIEERRGALSSALEQLLKLYRPGETQSAGVYEGSGGLKALLYELIDDARAGDEFLFFAFFHQSPSIREQIYPIYRDFEEERLRRRLILRGIVPEFAREFFKNRRQETLRYVPFPVPLNINIFRDKVSLTPGGDPCVSFLIRSTTLADQFRDYHAAVWKAAKRS